MQPSNVMTIDELADYLKIAKSSLYKLAQDGKLPAQKVGKHWRFSREAIDKWLARSVSSSVDQASTVHRARITDA